MKGEQVSISADSLELEGTLTVPPGAKGIVIFAHGSGSSRLSPRNVHVARVLNEGGLATLLFDLLTEEEARERENVFDIDFLAHRLVVATRWIRARRGAQGGAVGYFGASTGAAAALAAAAQDISIAAVVSRGGRPDLAIRWLAGLKAPTLLIVGGKDYGVIELNQQAYGALRCEKALEIVPGATHLFEEPGTLETVARLARDWLARHLSAPKPLHLVAEPGKDDPRIFASRAEAGQVLAAQLLRYGREKPVVVAIPRGGVAVAYEVARALAAPLDVIVVRKVGAPGQPELGLGAVVDGDHPEAWLNREIVRELGVSEDYLERQIRAQLEEVARREALFRGGRPRLDLKQRTVIVVDDGIATGGSVRAALRGLRRAQPKRVVLAVPVAPAETIEALRAEADEVVCLSTPAFFYAVGQFYDDFHQLGDDEVVRIIEAARRQFETAAEEAARA